MPELIGLLLAYGIMIWLMLFGIAVMLQQHPKFLAWSKKTAIAPFRNLWNKHRRIIIAIIVGILIGMFIMNAMQHD